MTLTLQRLGQIDHHWAVQAVPSDVRNRVFEAADERLVKTALGQVLQNVQFSRVDDIDFERVATAYEMAAIEGLSAVLHLRSRPEIT